MVKVKMRVSRTDAARGEEIEVDAAEAERMVAAEQAVILRGKRPEKAVKASKAERAAK